MNTKTNTEIKKEFYEHYANSLLKKIDLIANADINNPEAVELWLKVKDYDWVKPEIKEKWEKALKGVELNKKI